MLSRVSTGHRARNLESGGNLATVLKAGEWSSAAFHEYLDAEEVDQAALLDIICDLDEEESGDGSGAGQHAPPAAKAKAAPRKRAAPGAGSRLISEFCTLTEH